MSGFSIQGGSDEPDSYTRHTLLTAWPISYAPPRAKCNHVLWASFWVRALTVNAGWNVFVLLIKQQIRQFLRVSFVPITREKYKNKSYLLTYSMVQSPSWEANWFAASQEIPRISRNPKTHYRTHKRPPTVSILGQPNPVHIPTTHLLEIHLNIIHPSTPRSPQWLFPSGFPTKTL